MSTNILLLEDIKNYLDITWKDNDTNSKVKGIMNRAIRILQSYAGCEIDFHNDSDEKQLLLDCCRYIYNQAYEDFKINFHDELIMLRENYRINKMEENNEQQETSGI